MKSLLVHGLYNTTNPKSNSNSVSGLITLTLVLKFSYLVTIDESNGFYMMCMNLPSDVSIAFSFSITSFISVYSDRVYINREAIWST